MKKIALSVAILLFGLLNAHGQYMSFFGDSTWEYNVTSISQPPIDYVNNPPEMPNQLGVYCVTFSYYFRKDQHPEPYEWHGTWPLEEVYQSVYQNTGDTLLQDWDNGMPLYEDTVHGRLYQWGDGKLICDMSLSEGDTFLLEQVCEWNAVAPGQYYPWDPTLDLSFDISMLVDSVRYNEGRKVIYLSLLDHQDDYFFGTGSSGLLSDYHLSIRFIEGVGPTYGFHHGCDYPSSLYHLEAYYVYYYPWLPLLQCMYKDDSLVYLAHEDLGCYQSCTGDNSYIWEGVPTHSSLVMNLYPNPATEYVVLDLSTGEEMDGSVMITDMLGRQCLQQKAEGTKCQISVSDLPVGMYFLTYTDGKRKVTKKFLKE